MTETPTLCQSADLLCAAIVPGVSSGSIGYIAGDPAVGELDQVSFDFDGNTYTFNKVVENAGSPRALQIAFDSIADYETPNALVLHVGRNSFPFIGKLQDVVSSLSWDISGALLAAGVAETVRITVSPAPAFLPGAAIADPQSRRGSAITDMELPQAWGGDGALKYAITPALPAGLKFDPATRILSGTPTGTMAAQTYTYKVTDSDDDETAGDTDAAALTFTITVGTNTAPVFPGHYNRDFTVDENTPTGTNVGDPIAATDADNDTLSYTLDGADAVAFTIDSNGQLALATVPSYEDQTSYRLTINASDNWGGVANAGATIAVNNVAEPPGKPAAPAVTAATSTILSVSWSAPANAGPAITGYNVRYCDPANSADAASPCDSATAADWTAHAHSGTATAATIGGLALNTVYHAQVRAVNAEGTGAWSGSGAGSASANSPPVIGGADPVALTVAENTASGHSLHTFAAAADGDPVSWSLSAGDTGSFAIGGSSGALTTAAAFNYEGKNSYSVTVQASDGNGGTASVTVQAGDGNGGAASVAVNVAVSGVNVASGKPDAPAVAAYSGSSLKVSWSAPANTVPAITGYNVRHREGATGDWIDHDNTGAAPARIITGLDADTSYEVQVRAVNVDGAGAWSDSGTGSPDADLPGAPQSPILTSGNAKLDARWSQPNRSGVDAITDYDVRYCDASEDATRRWTPTGPTILIPARTGKPPSPD